jgi:quercetin dioxygenase-like cupin family protein
MVRRALRLAVVIGALLPATALAQATAPAAPAGQIPAPGRGANQGVGSQGDPDPGVHYVVIVDNPSVRVLQVTLQPGAARRQHVHNDVTFHMLIPVTGILELTAAGVGTINALPGQAYYMLKGEPHGFANKGAAPVQVVEIFVRPGAAPEPWNPKTPAAPAATPGPGATTQTK